MDALNIILKFLFNFFVIYFRHSLTMLKNETHEKKRPETSLNISSSNQLFQLPVNTDTCFKKLTPECTPRSVQTEQQQQLSDVMDMKLHVSSTYFSLYKCVFFKEHRVFTLSGKSRSTFK